MKAQDWPGELIADNASIYDYARDREEPVDGQDYPGEPMRQGQVSIDDGGQTSYSGERGLVPANTGLSLQQDRKANADEDIVFGDEELPARGLRLRPEQEAALEQAARSGDFGQVMALGQQFGINLNPDSVRATIAYLKEHPDAPFASGGPVSYANADQTAQRYADIEKYGQYVDSDPQALRNERDVLPEDADAFARGAALGFDDEIDGIVGALIYGGADPNAPVFDRIGDQIQRSRKIRDYDEQNNYIARGSGGLVASMLLPTKVSGVARPAAATAMREALAAGASPAAARALATRAAQSAIRGQMTREGAMYGAAVGAADADGGLADRGLGGARGALGGAGAGYGLASLGTIGRTPRPRGIPEGQQVIRAAERQGIDVLPADVGGPMTRRATSAMAQTIAGGQPIIAAAERTVTQSKEALERIAASVGRALDPEAGGGQAIRGARNAMDSTRDEAARLYSAAEKATEGFRANPVKALETLDRHIAELAETPGGAGGLAVLRSIRDDLAKGKTTVGGIRRMRTALRDQFAEAGLRGSDIERRTGEVVDAASGDILDSLAAAGKDDAVMNFARADAAWRARAQLIDNVFEPIIGTRDAQKSGEQVIRALTADLQGNNARAVKFLQALPPEEQANVRATIIGAMGRSAPGAQNAEGTAFSLPKFLTDWNKIGETAKGAYFGPETRAALNDLARVAQGTKAAQSYANRSNTGGVVGNLGTLATGFAGFPTLVATLGTQYGVGRLLADPGVARWLVKLATKPNAGAVRDHLRRLGSLAKARSVSAAARGKGWALEGQIESLQHRLEEALKVDTTPKGAVNAESR
jgi:hypothetical protein